MVPATEPVEAVFAGAEPHWYVAHTKPRQERLACENLVRQGYRTYLPRLKALKLLSRRQEIRYEPLFPRYLFFRPGHVEHSIAPVRSTHGVATIVRFGAFPALMRNDVLETIRSHECRQHAAGLEQLNPVQPGRTVLVANGPLAGLEGLVTLVSRDRVTVLMHLLGEETKVRLGVSELKLVA